MRVWDRTLEEVDVRVAVSALPDMTDSILSERVGSRAEDDFMAVMTVEGLKPDTVRDSTIQLDGRHDRTDAGRFGGGGEAEPTRLGPDPLVWLERTLKPSDATFKVLVSPVPWQGLAEPGPGKLDPWAGYRAEREDDYDLFEFGSARFTSFPPVAYCSVRKRAASAGNGCGLAIHRWVDAGQVTDSTLP